MGLAAHRDTFFGKLAQLEKNDQIIVNTIRGTYRYSVSYSEVVETNQTEVLEPSGNDMLTLVTCYPFYVLGSAPKRFIVKAKLVQGDRGA